MLSPSSTSEVARAGAQVHRNYRNPTACVSLTPRFSEVDGALGSHNRFSGFAPGRKPLKRFLVPLPAHTSLKRGVNERVDWF